MRPSTMRGLKKPAYASARDADAGALRLSLPFGPIAHAGISASWKRSHSRAKPALTAAGPPDATTRACRAAREAFSAGAAAISVKVESGHAPSGRPCHVSSAARK